MDAQFDLVIIGAGPGGYEAALEASRLGMKTAIVEKDSLGGTCLNRGCIPTKTMLHAAEAYSAAKTSSRFGVACESVKADYPAIYAYRRSTIETLRKGIATLLKSAKVTIYRGTAKLLPNNVTEIANDDGTTTITSEKILIATGSVPAVPPIPGADLPGVMTSDGLLAHEGEPFTSLTIIGGGVIGVEFASVYSALGTKVTIVEALPSLIANMDKELGQSLKMSLKKKGVDIHTDAKVTGLSKNDDGIECAFTEKGKELAVTSDAVLIATGRRPNTAGLFSDGCRPDMERGRITVDARYATSVKGVYAIGDVSGKIQLAHAATAQGISAVRMMAGKEAGSAAQLIPACIYTSPEIASVGMTLDEAKNAGFDAKSRKVLSSANGKSVISQSERGFVKIVYDAQSKKLLGCQMMCDRATDMISEIALALSQGMTLAQVENVCRPHPTFSEMLTEAARI